VSSQTAPLEWASRLLRFVPSGLGAHAGARRVIAWTQPLPSVRLRQRLLGGAFVELNLADRAQAQAYLTRRYEAEVVASLTRLVPPRGVFFDVGANVGLITFSVAARRPDISIHAFEPDPANAQCWLRNLELNEGARAVLEQVAFGAKEDEGTLLRGDESGWSFIAPPGSKGGIKVPMTTIDAYAEAQGFATIDALKVDVEGYECLVLQGAGSLLRQRAIGLIVCEVNEPVLERSGFTQRELISLLSGFGYDVRTIPHVGAQRLRRQSVESSGNLLFVPA